MSIKASTKKYATPIFSAILWILIIYAAYHFFSALPFNTSEGMRLFEGTIKNIVHQKGTRSQRGQSRIWLDNYDYDFILYHVPTRKEAILSLKKGQFVSFWASDDEVYLDRDDTKTFIILSIKTKQAEIKTIEDEIDFKEGKMERFFEAM